MTADSDKELLRRLAADVRELAELPEMAVRKRLWRKFIDLRPQRPMVLCYPEGSWSEILPDSCLQSSDPELRKWEWKLRSQLYWWASIRDDNVLEPFFDIRWDVQVGDFGVEIPFQYGMDRGSYRWTPPIRSIEKDFYKLSKRTPRVNRQKTLREAELAGELFGDLLPVRIRGNPTCFGLTWRAADLIGLENLMLFMVDDPEGLHRLMAFLSEDFRSVMLWYEQEGLLTLQNGNDYTGSGGIAYTSELPQKDYQPGGPVRLIDIWGVAESQETSCVSPDMFREFILPYQIPLLSLTGLNHYGCCEPLHARIDDLLKVPRMRRFSVSPWCDQKIMAEKLARRFIFSRKPNPSLVCAMFDEKAIRRDLSYTLEIAGSGVLEFVLKDKHTVQGQPWRLRRWVELAREEIDRFSGL